MQAGARLFAVFACLFGFLGQVATSSAATLFDDYMATLKTLSPRSADCVETEPGRSAVCSVSSSEGSFVVEYSSDGTPTITVVAVTPGRSMDGMQYTIFFNDALKDLGFTTDCFLESLNGNFRVGRFSQGGYDYECSASVNMASVTIEARFVVTSSAPVSQSGPMAAPQAGGEWPGVWQVTALPDGRLYARVEMTDDGDIEYGGFSSFGIICARGGGLKIGMETLDGTKHPHLVLNPDGTDHFVVPLVDNEMRGAQADQYLRDLASIEKMVRDDGSPDRFPLALSAHDDDAGYYSVFELGGITEVTERMYRECPQ